MILGAVIAGGRARRFGSDKALAVLDGRALIDHVAAALSGHVAQLVVCGRRHPPFPSLDDRPAPDMGPLGGLNAALHHAAARGFDAVLTAACDMPVFPDDLARALTGGGAAVVDGQPLMGHWPAGLAPLLDRHLADGGDLSMRRWIAAAGARTIDAPALPNINTPADLARLVAGRLPADGR